MGSNTARRWFVNGLVQGVGYRYFVQRKANELGLKGWTRNLDDGRVEVYAIGAEPALADLAGALHEGPRHADVRSVEEQNATVESSSGFSVR